MTESFIEIKSFMYIGTWWFLHHDYHCKLLKVSLGIKIWVVPDGKKKRKKEKKKRKKEMFIHFKKIPQGNYLDLEK